jgi:VWFA-related protein
VSTAISRRMFLAAATAAIAQAQDTTFSTDVKVVSVLATVRDKQGRIVTNLTKDDFDLAEDGRPQTIRYFSRESDLPLTLGLLVDTSGSQRQVLGEERTASRQFIEKVLREDRDQTFLIHFDHETELLQDLTASRAKLERALDDLELPAEQRPQLNRRGNGGGGYPGGGNPGAGRGGRRASQGTTLYDAILLASDELMRKRQGRKALIILSDGVDRGSKVPLTEAIDAAQKADTLVYSILFAGSQNQPQPTAASAGAAAGATGFRSSRSVTGPTERKCWSRSRARRAEAFSKSRRSFRSIRSTPASRRSCAANTASGLPATKPTRRAASAESP